jgi:uncharacterized membrane protein HdeD (DUF308 family)
MRIAAVASVIILASVNWRQQASAQYRLLSIFTGGHRKSQPPYFHSVHRSARSAPSNPFGISAGAVSAEKGDRG